MIDIHSHILPNVDDGSQSISETIEIARQAVENGVSKIVATPHYKFEVYNTDSKLIRKHVDMLNTMLKSSNIPCDILYGSEIMITSDAIQKLLDKELFTLNETRYALIEFSLNRRFVGMSKIINKLLSNNIIPIIAHPERYPYFEDVTPLIKYVEMGALLQIDIASLDGHYGKSVKKTAIKLLKHRLVHLWGSDSHRVNVNIYSKLDSCFEIMKKYLPAEMVNEVVYVNPQKVINNEYIYSFDIKYKIGLFK